MDETTQTPAENTPEVPAAVEPTAPAAETDFSELTDDQVTELATDAHAEAVAILDSEEEFTEDREAVYAAALARRDAANAELSRRNERAAKRAAAREATAEFAPTKVVRPAAAGRPAVPRVADIAKPTAQPVVPEQRPTFAHKLLVPTDAHNLVPGKAQGSQFASMDEVGKAMDRRLQTYGGMVKGSTARHTLAVIQRDYGPEFTVNNVDADADVVRAARNERRLAGGSALAAWRQGVNRAGSDDNALTAAAGWCAPSETLYDLCELESMDGLIELPELSATRGGFRWTPEPTYAQMDAATTFTSLTEAQVIAATAKNCDDIDCPPFTDTRLNIAATCVTGSFLQLRGYPELVARRIRGALVVHAHKLNEAIIAAIATQAGAATAITTPTDDAATSAVLSAVELAAEDIRYRNRMSFNDTLEVVLPHWLLPVLRADFARRNGGDPGLTNQQIAQWFTIRGVRPQFVYDWQDFYSGVAAPSIGSAAPYITALPATVNFLIYPAGGVVLARQDVITLTNVYDSTNLQQNLFTALFTEEGWAPIYPCNNVRQYSVALCPSGATGAQENWGCVDDAA